MNGVLNDFFESRGEKFRILPITCMVKLEKDVHSITHGEYATRFTKTVARFMYDLTLPDPGFDIASIIVAASPSPIVRIISNYNGRRIPVIMPPTYIEMLSKFKEIENRLNDILNPAGHHVIAADRLPQKILAVRSGLSQYGRNNVSYADSLGSFVRLTSFFSDIPCEETSWQDLTQMASCRTCTLCLENCPSKAILAGSYLVEASKCLTAVNEHQGNFPDWVEPSMHNCIIGCMKCQEVCPHNKKNLHNFIEPVEFTEEETLYILDDKPLNGASSEFLDKVKLLGIDVYYNVIPRNLRALIRR
jgi:epoxyqueuosine reductase